MSQEHLAEWTGSSDRTVRRALVELEDVGAIARNGWAGPRLRTTVKWRLPLLIRLRALPRSSDKMTDNEGPANMADNPSDSQRPQGSVERGRSGSAASAMPSAGASGSAGAAPSTGQGPRAALKAEIAEGLGVLAGQGRGVDGPQVAGATGHVRNEAAFLRRCLERELEQAEAARPSESGAKAEHGARGPERSAKGSAAKPTAESAGGPRRV
ncbi:hypothetical protein GCM10023215_02350 [Pseudonocardia yuanmonensis]|uniref:Uncharacterized protein n=1 Tax=Pseudonocardia yuanmonensis TaxID=1095914 RepID=A0ABP8VW44_9PSEU